MAITTFTELKSTVADYLVDNSLTAIIPTFIALCETRFQRDLRLRQMEAQSTLTVTAGTATVALPSGFLDARVMVLNSTPARVLNLKTPVQFFTDYASAVSGTPESYCIIGSNFHLGPTPSADSTITLTSYSKVAVLSDSNATNAVLDDAPDLYLYGTLLEAAPYLGEDARISVWVQLYDRAVAELKAVDERTAWSSGPLVSRVEVYTP
jgi:hypothetical protein